MPDVRTVLIKGLITAALCFVVSCAQANATPAKVERIMAIGCRIRVTADGEALPIEAVGHHPGRRERTLPVRYPEDQHKRHQPQYSKRQLQPGSQPGRSSFDDPAGCIRCGSLPGQVGARFKFRECLMRFALRNHLSAVAFTAAIAVASAQPVFADSAFVSQAAKGAFFGRSSVLSPVTAPSPAFFVPPPRGGATQ